MSSHVVYSFFTAEGKCVYVGSGTEKRPVASLSHSHVEGIRKQKETLEVRVSKLMPENEARQLEAKLIQELSPEFNKQTPKINFPVLSIFKELQADSPFSYRDFEEYLPLLEPALVANRYLVERRTTCVTIRDVNCVGHITISKTSVTGDLRNLYLPNKNYKGMVGAFKLIFDVIFKATPGLFDEAQTSAIKRSIGDLGVSKVVVTSDMPI